MFLQNSDLNKIVSELWNNISDLEICYSSWAGSVLKIWALEVEKNHFCISALQKFISYIMVDFYHGRIVELL